MSLINLKTVLVCPKCKQKVFGSKISIKCPKCNLEFKKTNGVLNFLYLPNRKNKNSQKAYEVLHKEVSDGPSDGSYEILASIARGNKTVDIACGEGIIEKLVPETVGVDFSLNALKKAKKSGVRNLVWADAAYLPFKDTAFDVAICAGSIEHFHNPQKAITEMVRVSKIQVVTIHKHPPIPFAYLLRKLFNLFFDTKDQPIEVPQNARDIEKMFKKSNVHIVFKGIWTLPFNYGRVIKFLPEIKSIPSCYFYISIKP